MYLALHQSVVPLQFRMVATSLSSRLWCAVCRIKSYRQHHFSHVSCCNKLSYNIRCFTCSLSEHRMLSRRCSRTSLHNALFAVDQDSKQMRAEVVALSAVDNHIHALNTFASLVFLGPCITVVQSHNQSVSQSINQSVSQSIVNQFIN